MNIVSRKTWGAANPNGPIYLAASHARTGFMVHHSVSPTGDNQAEVEAMIRGFQRQHKNNQWGDIGYNFLIDARGIVYEGRGLHAVGAHAGGANTANIGVCYVGDGRFSEMPEAAKRAFRKLYAWVNGQLGKTLATRVHSDANATACPGDFIRNWVKSGGLTVNVAPAAPKPRPPAAPSSGRPVIRQGSKNSHVADLQRALKTRYPLYAWNLAIDSDFGLKTRAAVVEFQRRSGIVVDGIVGPQTWAALSM